MEMPVICSMIWMIQKLAMMTMKPIIAPVRACLPLAACSGLLPLERTVKPAPRMRKKRIRPAKIRRLGRMVERRLPGLANFWETGVVSFSRKASSRLKAAVGAGKDKMRAERRGKVRGRVRWRGEVWPFMVFILA